MGTDRLNDSEAAEFRDLIRREWRTRASLVGAIRSLRTKVGKDPETPIAIDRLLRDISHPDSASRLAPSGPLLAEIGELLLSKGVTPVPGFLPAKKASPQPLPGALALKDGRFAIVAARFNSKYTDNLVATACEHLAPHSRTVEVFRVPGSFEIPVIASELVCRPPSTRPEAILCFGLIWQGKTSHASLISTAVTEGLMRISVESRVPCLHEILAIDGEALAYERCFGEGNVAVEASRHAVEMAVLLRKLRAPGRRASAGKAPSAA